VPRDAKSINSRRLHLISRLRKAGKNRNGGPPPPPLPSRERERRFDILSAGNSGIGVAVP